MGQQPFPWEFFAQGGDAPVITQEAGVRATALPDFELELDDLVKEMTARMREELGIKVESNNQASREVQGGGLIPNANQPQQWAVATDPDKKDESFKWNDINSRKLLDEMSREAFMSLQSINPNLSIQDYNGIKSNIAKSFLGDRSLVDPDFNVNSPEFTTLNDSNKIANRTIIKFENLLDRSRNNPNMLFQVNRLAEWRDSMYGQGLIPDEVYDALRNPSLNFKDESVQQQASLITQMLIINEPEWTDKVLEKTTTSFDRGTKSLVSGVRMQDIVEGTPNDVIDLLPLPAVTERNLIAQQREQALFNKFSSEKDLSSGINLLLGPAEEDEDGINKKARNRFIEDVENYRNRIYMNNPMLSGDEIEQLTYQYVLNSQTPQMGEYPGDDRSPYDRIWEAEAVKDRNKKREDARKTAFGKLDTNSKVQTAIKAFIEDNIGSGAAVDTLTLNELTSQYRKLVIEADATGMPVPDINAFMGQWDQQRLADGVPTLYETVAEKYFGDYTADTTRLDSIRTDLNLGADLPTDQALFPTGDYGAVGQVDRKKQELFAENPSLLMTAAGRKQVDEQAREFFAGYGMTPSGDLAEWSGTYRDPVTGEIKFAQGQDFVNNISKFDPATQYLFQRAGTAYNPGWFSAAEMFKAQRGVMPPALPSGLFGSTGMKTQYFTDEGKTPMKVQNGEQVVDMSKVRSHQIGAGPMGPSPGYVAPNTAPPNITNEPYFDLGYNPIRSSVSQPQPEFNPYPQGNILGGVPGLGGYNPEQWGDR